MTPSPLTIGRSTSLAAARRVMLDHRIRHLPVVEDREPKRVVGILAEPDILLIETLPGANPTELRAEDAMVRDPYTVSPDAPVAEVVAAMIDRKIGSALVAADDGAGGVLGVFTTIDALRGYLEALLPP
jgi:acetoin utilization protein AcuB